jgi:small-conductance mechanosensitive channel
MFVRGVNWRKARALLWVGITLIVLTVFFLFSGTLQIPGLPVARADLASLGPWVYVVPIIIATKALLEVLRPLFKAALRSHVKYEADIFAHFQIVSYVVWGTAFALVFFVIIGGGAQQFGFLGTAFVSAALIYVMQEPLLNVVGWVVLISMGLYKLGDRIEMNNSRGYVVEITPMNTTLREFGGVLYGDSFTGRYVTIPNSQILKGNVFNYTKDTPFVWDQLVMSITYESDVKLAERLIFEAAEEIVGPMMRENRAHLRSKYEFADLADYMAEEPRVGWSFAPQSVDLTLMYFCPVFAKGMYRTRLVKRILDAFRTEPGVQFAYPRAVLTPAEQEALARKEHEAVRPKEKEPPREREKLPVPR